MLQINFIQFYAIKRIRYFIWVNIEHFIVKILFFIYVSRCSIPYNYLIWSSYTSPDCSSGIYLIDGELPGIAISCISKQN